MILAINYSDDRYKIAQKFNSKSALKYGADKVREYGPADIDEDFKKRNADIFSYERGGGYWIWKSYILRDALARVNDGDYVIYTDAGSAFVNKIQYLINAMNKEKTDIMVFQIDQLEKNYSKRDAFILLECDQKDYVESYQRCGGYIVLKKSKRSVDFVNNYLEYSQDKRIITNQPNELGKDNYPGFVENRHDQTILSLLSKKWGIDAFRDPSEYGLEQCCDVKIFSEEVLSRSTYPQIIESHRNPYLKHWYQLNYKKWYRWFDKERSPVIKGLCSIKTKLKKFLRKTFSL